MVRWTRVFCSVFFVINGCAVVSAIAEELVASALNSSITETSVGPRNYKTHGNPHVERHHLPICCPNGSFSVQAYWCVLVENISTNFEFPPVYDAQTLEPSSEPLRIDDFDVLWNSCQGYVRELITPDLYEDGDYMLLSNGSIRSAEEILEYTNYCFAFYNTSEYSVVRCVEGGGEINDGETEGTNPAVVMILMFIVSLALRSISFSALLVTLVLYSIIPELRTVHGVSFRACFGQVIFTNLVALMRVTDLMQNMNTFLCIAYGFLTHFSNLAVFFWLNVLCFDMWLTFGSPRKASLLQSVTIWRRNKFIIYSIYAWGCSSLIAMVGLIMDLAPSTSTNFIRPDFDIYEKCFFKSTAAGFIYYYGPMGLVAFCNTCFFVLAAVKIIERKQNTVDLLEVNNYQHHNENMQRFHLYLKLFFVTGIDKTLNLIVWLCNYEPNYLYNISSLCGHAQGILIYMILVWKDKTCQSLRSPQDHNVTGTRRRKGVTSFVRKCLWRRASEAK